MAPAYSVPITSTPCSGLWLGDRTWEPNFLGAMPERRAAPRDNIHSKGEEAVFAMYGGVQNGAESAYDGTCVSGNGRAPRRGGALSPAAGLSAADTEPNPTGTGDISDAEMTELVESGGTPYVQADSPREAIKLLDQVERSPDRSSNLSTQYGPCTLKPSNMHLRDSYDYGAVGIKPKTSCSTYVTTIRHTVDFRYKSALWWRLAATKKTGPARKSMAHTSWNLAHYCKGGESTGWVGVTLGTVVYAHKTYYARAYSPKTTLNCGG